MKISNKKLHSIKRIFPIFFSIKILLILLLIIASFLFGILVDKTIFLRSETNSVNVAADNSKDLANIQNQVLKEKYVFKIKWEDLGEKMVGDGVIDKTKLAQAITGTDELSEDLEKYFSGNQNQIELTSENSNFWVDVLWGLGLANKNKVLETGEMIAEGDTNDFASTGGWSLGTGDPMNHYSGHYYINLSDKQQELVEEIAGNIYRPCCGNSTMFPDCNHGMAALGLIELMASQDFSKDEIYKTVLAFNINWFPETYLNTAYYLKQNDRDYEKISAKEILSKTFSSSMGSESIQKKVGNIEWFGSEGGGSCEA